jgi:predicted  nucleic acid-binding Zn-ribbon protein
VAVDNLVSDSIALEAYIDILQSDSTSLEAYIDDLQSDSVALADDIAGLEDYITGLESHISSLLSDSLDLEIHVYNLQLDSASFEVTIDGLQGDIVNLNNEVAGLLDDFSDLEFNLAETITDYNNQISNLNNAHDAEVEAINLAHANLVSGIEEDALNAANAAADLLAFTIDSASVAFAQDESADEALLAQTIQDFENQIDVLNNNDAAEDYEYESIIDALQADSLDLENHIYNLQQDSLSFESTIDGLEDEILNLNANINDLSSDLAYHSAPIEIDLVYGWNMIGFSLQEPMDAPASLEILGSDLHLIKNNSAQVYWPEFGFNSLGILVPGQGYQIRMYNAYDNFTFPYIPGVRLEVQPDVPAWVQEMELPLHPNDVRSLVRVVNTIGQEVNPEDVFDGEVLIYLYSDGTVEKAIK